MFTGLIETTGAILSIEQRGSAVSLGIKPALQKFTAEAGASVAVDGACLTVEYLSKGVLSFTAVHETLSRTTLSRARPGMRVNLERPLSAAARFDGHIVLGHIDGVGTIIGDRHEAAAGLMRTIEVPTACLRFMAEKGSIAIDGISLTIARAEGTAITVALIPRTLETTTMGKKGVGEKVNIECDVIARYLDRLLFTEKDEGTPSSLGSSLLTKLERSGF